MVKGNYYFQYKEEVVKTGHCEEVNGTEPSPLVRLPWLNENNNKKLKFLPTKNHRGNSFSTNFAQIKDLRFLRFIYTCGFAMRFYSWGPCKLSLFRLFLHFSISRCLWQDLNPWLYYQKWYFIKTPNMKLDIIKCLQFN